MYAGALFVSAVMLSGLTFDRSVDEPSRKGIRAIILDGAVLEKPIRSYGMQTNMALFNALTGAYRYGNRAATNDLDGRPCIRMSSIMATIANERVPLDRLRPEDALFQHWIFPAVDGQLLVTRGGYAIDEDAAEILRALGVPLELDSDRAVGECRPWESQSSGPAADNPKMLRAVVFESEY